MLFEIIYTTENIYTKDTKEHHRYVVGNSKQDAYKMWQNYHQPNQDYNVKDISIMSSNRFRNLDGTPYSLYSVDYECFTYDFSKTYHKKMIVIGRCRKEAVAYAKAFLDSDTMNHVATKLDVVIGKTIYLTDADVDVFKPIYL